MTQALHEIAEKLAAKEIEINPKEFVNRETISRGLNKLNGSVRNADQSDNTYLSLKEESIKNSAEIPSFGGNKD